MAFLVDTSVFISLEREGGSLEEFLAEFAGESIGIAAITASELLAGVHGADSQERRRVREPHVESILHRLDVLPFDLATARTHAAVWNHLASIGQTIGRHDLLIAATALAQDYAVLTENVREFSRVPGLEVRSHRS